MDLLSTTTDEYAKFWNSTGGKLSNYEWMRNFHSVQPLRWYCSNACWLSDSAWTEWKSFSLPRPEFVAWLPDSTPPAESWQMMLGIKPQPWHGNRQYETNTAVQKNVQQLRISKSLICDELREKLTTLPASAWTPSLSSVFVTTASRAFGKTSWQSSALDSSRPRWIGDQEIFEIFRTKKGRLSHRRRIK